jgi:DNA-binding transcriptional MocR family regulator
LDGWVHLKAENLAARLALALRQLIAVGLLAPGEQLPPERLLARSLHVSRPTVSAALDSLREAGLVVSRQGSGTRVASPAGPSGPAQDNDPFASAMLATSVVNLAAAVPFDASHLPSMTLFTADLLTVLPDHGVAPLGLDALRNAAAGHLTKVGLPTRADQIVVTAGGHHALRAVFDVLAQPTAPVLVEEYTYGAVIDLAERAGSTLIGLPGDADGVQPDRLDTALSRTRPAFVLLAPSIHSPTGQATARQRLQDLADVLNAHRAVVVIDETYAELHYDRRPTPLASMIAGPAVTIESTSKTGWAGLRTGWIRVSDDLRPRVLPAFQRDLGQPIPSQLLALKLLTEYDQLLPRRRRDLSHKAHVFRQYCAEHLSDWSIVVPHGGLTHWIDTGGSNAASIVASARKSGLLIAAGTAFHHHRAPSSFVRICHDRPEPLLAAAIARLATGDWLPGRGRQSGQAVRSVYPPGSSSTLSPPTLAAKVGKRS